MTAPGSEETSRMVLHVRINDRHPPEAGSAGSRGRSRQVSSHNTGSSKRRSGASPWRAGWIRNAPIRRKLAMIIVIPLATVLALTVLQFTSTVKAAQSASRLSGLISVSTAAAQLADDLQQERTAAVMMILGGTDKL